MEALNDDEYEVVIDSTLENGHLTYGECFLPGELPDEIIFSCHCCHPSLCNDNLSGIALATFLARHLAGGSTTILVPLSLYSGNDWGHHVAGA